MQIFKNNFLLLMWIIVYVPCFIVHICNHMDGCIVFS